MFCVTNFRYPLSSNPLSFITNLECCYLLSTFWHCCTKKTIPKRVIEHLCVGGQPRLKVQNFQQHWSHHDTTCLPVYHSELIPFVRFNHKFVDERRETMRSVEKPCPEIPLLPRTNNSAWVRRVHVWRKSCIVCGGSSERHPGDWLPWVAPVSDTLSAADMPPTPRCFTSLCVLAHCSHLCLPFPPLPSEGCLSPSLPPSPSFFKPFLHTLVTTGFP